MVTVVVGSFLAIAADARGGNPDPWWAYLIGPGIGLALGGLFFFVVIKGRVANRRAAERDAARTYTLDDPY